MKKNIKKSKLLLIVLFIIILLILFLMIYLIVNKKFFIENNINKTSDTIIWINNNENRLRIHDLKNQDVFCKINDKKATGVKRINILTIIYLKA